MAELVLAPVTANKQLGAGYFALTVAAPAVAAAAVPGQFVQLKCGAGWDPLLRRPISVHRCQPSSGTVEFLIRQQGKGTLWLARQTPGAVIDLLGPLGKGFTLTKAPALLVGGGIGAAPLLALAEALHRQGNSGIALLGGNAAGDLLKLDQFQAATQRVQVATVDGSAGKQGLVTALLERELAAGFTGFIYTCGPAPMLSAVARLAARYGVAGEASLEAHMACGIGACLGCICKIKGEGGPVYAKVCTEGPVFPLEVISDDGDS